MTLIAVLGSIILALLGLVSWLFGKKSTSDAPLKNNDVKDQLNVLDGQLEKNKALIDAEKEIVKEKEANETNDSIINDLNKRK